MFIPVHLLIAFGIAAILMVIAVASISHNRAVKAREAIEAAMILALVEENLVLTTESTTDALTGIANRRQLNRVLDYETHRAMREQLYLSFVILDVDKFKDYNDYYGHQGGDECLQLVAIALGEAIRRCEDLLARYGGEEFAVVLPETDLSGALFVAERLRAAVQTMAIEHRASPLGVVTISIGVSGFAADRYRLPQDYIAAADRALYLAKHAGRNCVRAAPDVPPDHLEYNASSPAR